MRVIDKGTQHDYMNSLPHISLEINLYEGCTSKKSRVVYLQQPLIVCGSYLRAARPIHPVANEEMNANIEVRI